VTAGPPPLISVVLPVHNQAAHIGAILASYHEVLAQLGQPYEIVLSVNGSSDDSVAVCEKLAQTYPEIRVVADARAGWGLAVKNGLLAARGDLLCYTNCARTSAADLQQLLLKASGFEVVLTRDTDVFIPLEERTAIANRAGADLFLSIHANASRNAKARGVETYLLNFASNPDAEAVAARENSASGQTMHNLPDIVRAITLNNKLDESRDFATLVQRAMIDKLGASNKQIRDLGVRQAPFVVLIGAGMPSILAEISFLTHQQEGKLLKTPAYRQKIAEALFAGVQEYQRSLKAVKTAARQ